ncbi:MAG TPA: maleylpyruvate isomerase N-terminal domain-containing protein, partial [Mycobacterium sp.]|nr:maleylpyruvate isomerase N-terminal domain-containing protein [Mycobacterium sp.]
MMDLTPACQRTSDVLANVTDAQLAAATPCNPMRLRDLVQHIGELS